MTVTDVALVQNFCVIFVKFNLSTETDI